MVGLLVHAPPEGGDGGQPVERVGVRAVRDGPENEAQITVGRGRLAEGTGTVVGHKVNRS